jgi:hypothetical protein
MLPRFAGGLVAAAVLLTAGCSACHKCGHSSVASASPCCPQPAPCCPPGGAIPPPPGVSGSGYAPPIVSIPGH